MYVGIWDSFLIDQTSSQEAYIPSIHGGIITATTYSYNFLNFETISVQKKTFFHVDRDI